jgi:hypothetical protein
VGRVLEVERVGAVDDRGFRAVEAGVGVPRDEHRRRVDIGETLLERFQPVEGDRTGHMDVGEVGLVNGL